MSWTSIFGADPLRAHPRPSDFAMQWVMDRDRPPRQAAVCLRKVDPCGVLQVASKQKTAVVWHFSPVGAVADAHLSPAKQAKLQVCSSILPRGHLSVKVTSARNGTGASAFKDSVNVPARSFTAVCFAWQLVPFAGLGGKAKLSTSPRRFNGDSSSTWGKVFLKWRFQ